VSPLGIKRFGEPKGIPVAPAISRPHKLAELVALLMSPRAAVMTGAGHVIDGGAVPIVWSLPVSRPRAGLDRDGNRLQACRNALVPRRADPRIAILARRELVGPDAGANALRSLQMIEAETIR
jgi:hypothetical protein